MPNIIQLPYHWFDYRIHACGCITVFDTVKWDSVALQRCAAHNAAERRGKCLT